MILNRTEVILVIKIKFINFVLYCIILITFLLFQTCSDSGKDPIAEEIPVIEFINLNSNWNLAETAYNKVEVKILDPQGVENIDSVTIKISTSIGEIILVDRLYDDGTYYHTNDGDVIAGDGVFSNQFVAATDIGKMVGDYQVEIQKVRLEDVRMFLKAKRDFLVRLLENPSLLEHESFTDLLWAGAHLMAELTARDSLEGLPQTDLDHIANDVLHPLSQ